MKYKVSDIIGFMENWAKPEEQESWDNSGFQLMLDNETDKIILSLDITDEVIDYAINNKANLIISHHPMIMGGIKNIDIRTYKGLNLIKAIKNDISIYSAHTSLDVAYGGVNDTIAKILGLNKQQPLAKMDNGINIGIVGELEKSYTSEEIETQIKDKFQISYINKYGRKNDNIKKIALCGGSGAEFIKDAIENDIDLYITGDIKHHDAQYGYEEGLYIFDISHYESERPVLNTIKSKLKEKFNLEIILLMENYFNIR